MALSRGLRCCIRGPIRRAESESRRRPRNFALTFYEPLIPGGIHKSLDGRERVDRADGPGNTCPLSCVRQAQDRDLDRETYLESRVPSFSLRVLDSNGTLLGLMRR